MCAKPKNVFLEKFNLVNKMAKSSPFDFKKIAAKMGQKDANKNDLLNMQKISKKDEGKDNDSNTMELVNMQKDGKKDEKDIIMQLVNMQKNGKGSDKDEKDGILKMVDMTKNKDAKMLHLSKIFPTKWRTIAPIIEADEGEGRRLGGHEGGKGKGKKKP